MFHKAIRKSSKERNLEKAISEGDKESQFRLGVRYDTELRFMKNHQWAVKFYEQSANQGNASAQNNLGVFLNWDWELKRIFRKPFTFINLHLSKNI